MNYLKKLNEKIKDGTIKEVFREAAWIYQYGLRYKGSILWYICIGILGTILSLVASVLSKYIIDAVTGFNRESIAFLAVAYIVLQIIVIGMRAVTTRISAFIDIKVNQEIGAEVYDQIMESDWEAMSEFHSGDLLNRIQNDVNNVSSSVIGWVPNFITRSIQFIGTLVIIIYYDVTLAVLALLSAPIMFFVSKSLMKRMRHYNEKMREVGSEMTAFHGESFQNIQLIKSFGLSSVYGMKLRNLQKKHKDLTLEYNRFSVLTSTFMSSMGTAISILCFGWGVYRLWTGHITFGTMTLFLQLSSTLSGSFSALVQMIPSAITATTCAGRIMAVTELPKEIKSDEAKVEQLINNKEPISVEAQSVDFTYYTGEKVLEDVSFQAHPGEIVALVGPSGEGKTTLLRILLGIVSVKKGNVHVWGEEQKDKIAVNAATRSLFAYVPQENILFSGTIAENLRIVKSDATDEELDEVLRIACAYEFVHNLPDGLNSLVKEHGGGFSEGQIQRLAIARAMLIQAPVLLLDEATSALDITTEHHVLENIMKAKKACTCIVTTHRPSVLRSCDRIYRIAGTQMKCLEQAEVDQMIHDFL